MRRIQRVPLSASAQAYLDQRQQDANVQHEQGKLDIERRWADARQTAAIKADTDSVLSALRSMAGRRARCMYCSDSRGTDIEHFRPKSSFPEHGFLWSNLLLCCTDCGRRKGAVFPVDAQGQPLLIDPSAEDPWEHLDFDPDTGILVARWLAEAKALSTFSVSAKGEQVTKMFPFDMEAVRSGFQRTYAELQRTVQDFLARPADFPNDSLIRELLDVDSHGLLPWCWGAQGQTFAPFSTLRCEHPDLWNTLAAYIRPALP